MLFVFKCAIKPNWFEYAYFDERNIIINPITNPIIKLHIINGEALKTQNADDKKIDIFINVNFIN